MYKLGIGYFNKCLSAHSTGLMPGSLQITPDGQSILAMHDAQTTGGYPRILVVNQHDLSVLAQAKPGDEICFFRVS
ncbi:MAG: biotin-dependent carboxyltransferase family protein [Xanthomonadales bacterium]|nr:biotin-dependent carboxyltransferase family protein [Xanthomonadales bacterium]